MMTLPGRLSARSISVALLAVGVLIGAGLTIRGIASMWLPDLGIEVKPAGYAVLSLFLVGFVGSALGGLVVFLRGPCWQ